MTATRSSPSDWTTIACRESMYRARPPGQTSKSRPSTVAVLSANRHEKPTGRVSIRPRPVQRGLKGASAFGKADSVPHAGGEIKGRSYRQTKGSGWLVVSRAALGTGDLWCCLRRGLRRCHRAESHEGWQPGLRCAGAPVPRRRTAFEVPPRCGQGHQRTAAPYSARPPPPRATSNGASCGGQCSGLARDHAAWASSRHASPDQRAGAAGGR